MDDRDLDDAALWAVIDSAAASHSSSKHRKTLAIKYPNHQYSPHTPISYPSPPSKLPQRNFRNKQQLYSPSNTNSYSEDYHRPHKMARPCASEVSESSPLAVVQRTPTASPRPCPFIQFPETYLSPEIGKFDSGGESEVLPGKHGRIEEGLRPSLHSLSGKFPSVKLFKEYQNSAMAILEKSDYTMISGSPFIKKSGWRKISFYFNLSFEIKDKTIEFDESRNVQRAEFVVRAYMQGGRFCDGWGSCERREKRFLKPNHDIPSTAETRAKNKACQDLLGIGEYRPGAGQFQQQT